ncbi:succinate dehydrogenase [Asimina triloba]
MGESSDSSNWGDFSWNPWTYIKKEMKRTNEYWDERFRFLDNYTEIFLLPEKPLPKWSTSDVEEFIASDPVHGPTIPDLIVSVEDTLRWGKTYDDEDEDLFLASNPSTVYYELKIARKTSEVALAGGAIGAVTTAAQAWKYSKSPHGAVLAFGAGAVFGWTFGYEIANHWFQLYRLDPMTSQRAFLDWWKNKSGGNR